MKAEMVSDASRMLAELLLVSSLKLFHNITSNSNQNCQIGHDLPLATPEIVHYLLSTVPILAPLLSHAPMK